MPLGQEILINYKKLLWDKRRNGIGHGVVLSNSKIVIPQALQSRVV